MKPISRFGSRPFTEYEVSALSRGFGDDGDDGGDTGGDEDYDPDEPEIGSGSGGDVGTIDSGSVAVDLSNPTTLASLDQGVDLSSGSTSVDLNDASYNTVDTGSSAADSASGASSATSGASGTLTALETAVFAIVPAVLLKTLGINKPAGSSSSGGAGGTASPGTDPISSINTALTSAGINPTLFWVGGAALIGILLLPSKKPVKKKEKVEEEEKNLPEAKSVEEKKPPMDSIYLNKAVNPRKRKKRKKRS